MPDGEQRERPAAVPPREALEQRIESKERPPGAAVEVGAPQEQPHAAESAPPAPAPTPVAVAVIAKDAYRMKIERVLENGLVEIYVALPPDRRALFKAKGEETAAKLRLLMDKTKLNFGKVLELIRDWLKIIPRVNRFYLEQEAKIKADRIVLIHAELQGAAAVRL